MNKIYKVAVTTGFKEDIAVAERELGSSDLLYIYDATDNKGRWEDEIWSEEQLDFPRREEKENYEIFDDLGLTWWEINVPHIGKGILFQDASPMAIAFKREDLVKSKVNLHYDEYIT